MRDYSARVSTLTAPWAPLASLSALAATALLFSTGCSQPEEGISANELSSRMARGECDALMACDCPDNNYEGNLQACFFDRLAAYDTFNNAAFIAGLNYDDSCAGRRLDTIADLACNADLPELPTNLCIPACSPWHGSAKAGESCDLVVSNAQTGLSASTCAQGLSCIADFCVDPCNNVQTIPSVGEACPDMLCEEGAICDAVTTPESPVCIELPGVGDPCFSGLCDAEEAVCIPAADVCGKLPAAGQPCEQSACEPDAFCNPDDTCEYRPALVCGWIVDIDNDNMSMDGGETGESGGSDEFTTLTADGESDESDSTSTSTETETETGENEPFGHGNLHPDCMGEFPTVVFETNLGTLVIALYPDEAPETVANFLGYVSAGFYDQTLFHRVVDGFVLQGGGFDLDATSKPTEPSIALEINPDLVHYDGTLAMARTQDPDSATSQWYITDGHQPDLDGQYAVFGQLIEGFAIRDLISSIPVGISQFTVDGETFEFDNVPTADVVLLSAYCD